jgi:hypothetical protein
MKDTQRIEQSMIRRTVLTLATLAVAISMTACSHAMMMIHGTGAKRPAASEFGLGPRSSAESRYVATLEPAKPLRPRQMQIVRVTVRDAEGRAIDEAQISVDGGMPLSMRWIISESPLTNSRWMMSRPSCRMRLTAPAIFSSRTSAAPTA